MPHPSPHTYRPSTLNSQQEEVGGARRGRWVKRLAVAGAVLMACLVAAVVVAPSSAPAELLMGGGFLGDLPQGGMNGHARVRDLKDVDHSQGQSAAKRQVNPQPPCLNLQRSQHP